MYTSSFKDFSVVALLITIFVILPSPENCDLKEDHENTGAVLEMLVQFVDYSEEKV